MMGSDIMTEEEKKSLARVLSHPSSQKIFKYLKDQPDGLTWKELVTKIGHHEYRQRTELLESGVLVETSPGSKKYKLNPEFLANSIIDMRAREIPRIDIGDSYWSDCFLFISGTYIDDMHEEEVKIVREPLDEALFNLHLTQLGFATERALDALDEMDMSSEKKDACAAFIDFFFLYSVSLRTVQCLNETVAKVITETNTTSVFEDIVKIQRQTLNRSKEEPLPVVTDLLESLKKLAEKIPHAGLRDYATVLMGPGDMDKPLDAETEGYLQIIRPLIMAYMPKRTFVCGYI